MIKYSMNDEIARAIYKDIGRFRAERGAMLGGDPETGKITHYHYDDTGTRSSVAYSPDVMRLNRVLEEKWNPKGIRLVGFVHSHPRGIHRPSEGDRQYATNILKAIPDLPWLYLPIVQTEPDCGKFTMGSYIVQRSGKGRVHIEPCKHEFDSKTACAASQDAPHGAQAVKDDPRLEKIFARVRSSYDLPRMFDSTVVCVGCGGSASFLLDLARTGVGRFVLVDGDRVSETNLATQHVYLSDVGRYKVDALADRIHDINPSATVERVRRFLDDAVRDAEVETWIGTKRSSARPLLCGFTDSFHAQARVNLIALKYGTMSLCAQMYRECRGAEVTFTHPDTTTSCHRCILKNRFDAYLDDEQPNDVTSAGATIVGTSRVNEVCCQLALALLHHGSGHERWGQMLSRIGNRNLVLLRLDPDAGKLLGVPVFDKVFGTNDSVFFDEAIWRREDPEPCPDCGGTGNLLMRAGHIEDTRKLRKSSP